MKSRNVAIVSAIFLSGSSIGLSAPISWQPAVDTGGKTDLIEGATVIALNGGSDNLTITDGGSSGASSYSFTASDYTTISFAPTGGDVADVPRAGIGVNQYTPSTALTTGDSEFDSLVSSVAYAFGSPTGIVTGTMTIEGLTAGTEYQIQVFFNDQRSTTDTRVMTYGDGLGNTAAVAAGDSTPDVQTDHYGQFVVGTFTADATTQALTMDSTAALGFGNIHYNAILVTGPSDTNVSPQLADAAFKVDDGAAADTLVATLVATDGNQDDVLSYSITDGDPGGVFSLDASSGELTTTSTIDSNDGTLYELTVEVSDGTATASAVITVTVIVPAGEGMITWGPAQNTSSVDDLLSGPVVFARNGGALITVGGIDFEPVNLGNGVFANVYGGAGIFSTGDTDFDTLISGFTFGGGAGTVNLPGDITGLTPGRRYSVQVFFNDQRIAQSARVMTFGDGQGNSVEVGAGATLGTGEPDDYGQYAVGEFVAQSTTQVLQLTPGGFGNSHVNAILVVEGTGSPADVRISEFTFDPETDEVSLTWNSTPGSSYALRYSTDLSEFEADLDDGIPASEGETTTETFTLPAELIGLPQLFFRIEPNG